MWAKNDISEFYVEANTTADLTADTGKIEDTDGSVDITAAVATLKATLEASTGIGEPGNAIDTDITELEATNSTSGDIYIHEIDTTSTDGLTTVGTGVRNLDDDLAGAGEDIGILVDDGNLTAVVEASGAGSSAYLTTAAGSIVSSNVTAVSLADLTASNNIEGTYATAGTVEMGAGGSIINSEADAVSLANLRAATGEKLTPIEKRDMSRKVWFPLS